MVADLPDFAALNAAAVRLVGRVRRTPVWNSEEFDRRVGRRVWFKCENLQRGGAFKIRGALNAALQIQRPVGAGPRRLITHSSGNHGAALALAARDLGFECVVVMPVNSAAPKLDAVKAAGARVVSCAPGIAAREAALQQLQKESPADVVHPYDDARVIAGQGTAALELLQEHPDLALLLAPIGGGGLIGGTALAARGLRGASCKVFAAEPLAADDAARSFRSGRREESGTPDTIADGLRGALGVRNFALLLSHVEDVLTVTESDIIAAMRILLQDLKLLVEPSAAVPVAALLACGASLPPGDVGIILSGGNVDLAACPFLSPAAR